MKKIIKIEGMHCDHCKKSVTEALKKIRDIHKVEVDVREKTATVEMLRDVEDRKLKEVIEDIGFVVREIKIGR